MLVFDDRFKRQEKKFKASGKSKGTTFFKVLILQNCERERISFVKLKCIIKSPILTNKK